MILDLVPETDPILHEKMPPYDFEIEGEERTLEIARDLYETLMHNQGLGLAAPQVGLRKKVFIMLTDPIRICFNPRIVDQGDDTIELDEACLSLPGILLKIKRPKNIRVRYSLPNHEVVTEVFHGMTARIFQHEFDHLNGILITDHVSKLKQDIAMRKARKQTIE